MKPTIDPAALPLRDIHLPTPPSWWPPAPGWWLLAFILIVIPVAWLAWRHWRQRTALRRAALLELAHLRKLANQPTALVQQAALLVRRISLALDPARAHVALTGEPWLARIRTLAPAAGGVTVLAMLGDAPYQAQPHVDPDALLNAIETWIRALPARAPRLRHV